MQVQGNLNNVTQIATGSSGHSLALRADGTVWGWGNNRGGQVGDGMSGPHLIRPLPVLATSPRVPTGNIIALEAGSVHSVALVDDGTVWTWGSNVVAQLGIGTPAFQNATAIAAAGGNTYALHEDGTVWAWGQNLSGQLGIPPSARNHATPTQIQNLDNVVAIAAGPSHAVALREDGTVWSWGSNTWGQMGNGDGGNRHPYVEIIPVQAQGLYGVTA